MTHPSNCRCKGTGLIAVSQFSIGYEVCERPFDKIHREATAIGFIPVSNEYLTQLTKRALGREVMGTKSRLHKVWLWWADRGYCLWIWRPLCWAKSHIDSSYGDCLICGQRLK